MLSKRTIKYAILATVFIALTACQATRKTLNLPTSVELSFFAQQNTNPDNDGRPSPVVVRVFKLLDDRQFSREDFLNLYENADDRLGRDLIDTVVLKELAPDEDRLEILELSPDIKYIGLLAEFVQYENAEAIVVLPITEHKKNVFTLHIDSTSIYAGEYKQPRRSSKINTDGAKKIHDGAQTLNK